jgi:hypothetical protein
VTPKAEGGGFRPPGEKTRNRKGVAMSQPVALLLA